MKRTYKLLSIDAWADGSCGECNDCQDADADGCDTPNWTWNDMWTIDMVDRVPETVEEFARLVYHEDAITPEFLASLGIEDDQYNITLFRVSNFEPLYAVEYGNTPEIEGDES